VNPGSATAHHFKTSPKLENWQQQATTSKEKQKQRNKQKTKEHQATPSKTSKSHENTNK